MRNQQTWTRARPEIQGNSYITEECNTTKTTRPLHRMPAKKSQTPLQTPCCSTVLSDCAKKRLYFFSQLLEKIGVKMITFQGLSDARMERDTFYIRFSREVSQWAEALTYLFSMTGRTQAGKVLPTGNVSGGWDSPVIHANSSYNKSISSEFDLGNRAKGTRKLVLDPMTSAALSLYAFHSQSTEMNWWCTVCVTYSMCCKTPEIKIYLGYVTHPFFKCLFTYINFHHN